MANRVTISTIGTPPPQSTLGQTGQQAVEAMAAFWEDRMQQVWPDRPDLVVVPEFCDRFHDYSPEQMMEFCSVRGDQILERFQEQARRHNCYLTYPSMRDHGDGTFRNSLTMIGRDGEIAGIYDKNYIVIDETKWWKILSGTDSPLIECDFGTVGAAICFDLNFDELRLRYKAAKPDLIVFSSMYHGGLMQSYWAYSCRAHFVSALGSRGLRSGMISPTGQTLASTTVYKDHVTATVNLDCCMAHLDENWEKLPALKARYGREVTIADPDLLGSVLITSESQERTALEMAREFEIELLDDYMARSSAHRDECLLRGLPLV